MSRQENELEMKDAQNSRKKVLMAIIAGTVAIIVLAAGFGIYYIPENRLTKQLDLGNKYLEELNYEQAVVAFQAAIKIAPKSADAYLGLVEVYIRTGEFDMALEYAQKGYEMTGDERLKEKIEMIESGNITSSNGWEMRTEYCVDDRLRAYRVNIYGAQGVEKMVLCDSDHNVIGEGVNQYDSDGNITVEWGVMGVSSIDQNPTLIKIEYEYDADGYRICETEYDKDGNFIHRYINEYDEDGQHILQNRYDENGNLYSYVLMEYDKSGYLIRSNFYNEHDGLEGYYIYEHDENGYTVCTEYYNGDGSLVSHTIYEYDADGNIVRSNEN